METEMKQPRYSREDIRTTLNMAWPAMLESFFTAFAGLVDSLMVSSLGSYAVAAVGLTGIESHRRRAEKCVVGRDCRKLYRVFFGRTGK